MRTTKGKIAIGLFAILFLLPLFLSRTYLGILGLTFLFVIIVVSWDLLVGYSGQLNLGHTLFVGFGAYTAGLLFLQERFEVYELTAWLTGIPDIPKPVLVIIGGIIAALVGIGTGVICLRLKGFYLGLVTAVLPLIFMQAAGILAPLTGSYEGFTIGLKGALHPSPAGRYYYALIAMIISLGTIYYIINSRWGLIFESIRDNENLARSAGINTLKYKLLVFSLSAFFAGIAGGLWVFYEYTVGTHLVHIPLMLLVILGAVLGGTGTFYGPIIGGFIVYILKMWVFQDLVKFLPLDLPPEMPLFILLIILILTFPEGIIAKIKDII
ncbi:hypothetical protein AKJ62_03415 [candidate division MSBL1 archaeon SCGC-AAA259D14]|uniref:Branched-chain amino acid ABC transporter permease n=1 Tax=candidate division MSBL1 archaeon SCGC-AAA259D14 TaxID=1698261 RepID=A0A133U545_9EURY|nr:hypothetical protein AKJ62_03415 [candidate division MSBL1 archaeon SCGC-AAA259D14]